MNTQRSVVIAAHPHLGFEGLEALIRSNPNYKFLSYATDQSALEQALSHKPDALIICYQFASRGIGITFRELFEISPNTCILVLSARSRSFDSITGLYQSGVKSFLCSSEVSTQELFEALHAITNGKSYYCRSYHEQLTARVIGHENTETHGMGQLGCREMQVLSLIAQGYSAKEIARLLDISLHTVQVHRRNIMNKLDLHKSTELTRYAIEQNMLDLQP